MYRFTKLGDTVADRYSPEVVTTTDAADAVDLLRAFRGFLVAGAWHPETVDNAILELAEELQEDDE